MSHSQLFWTIYVNEQKKINFIRVLEEVAKKSFWNYIRFNHVTFQLGGKWLILSFALFENLLQSICEFLLWNLELIPTQNVRNEHHGYWSWDFVEKSSVSCCWGPNIKCKLLHYGNKKLMKSLTEKRVVKSLYFNLKNLPQFYCRINIFSLVINQGWKVHRLTY